MPSSGFASGLALRADVEEHVAIRSRADGVCV
jgi:hypothetical protein